MNGLKRIVAFGFVSGLVWSLAPGMLTDLFSTRADLTATLIASVIAGVVTSAILAPLVAKFGRAVAVVFGLLSLPLGAFAFGFSLTVINRFLPIPGGTRALGDPWDQGFYYALLSVISVFAVGFFPLAVLTTLLLRRFVRGQDDQCGLTSRGTE
jgi:hypothetical protein